MEVAVLAKAKPLKHRDGDLPAISRDKRRNAVRRAVHSPHKNENTRQPSTPRFLPEQTLDLVDPVSELPILARVEDDEAGSVRAGELPSRVVEIVAQAPRFMLLV